MKKILVLYYSMYGHLETMAAAIAEGAREQEGVQVVIKRVPETIPHDQAQQFGVKLEQAYPEAVPSELPDYDGIIFGTPTRFGNMAAQMRNFLDQTGGLWAQGKLINKVASVFTSTGSGGGRETTITSFWSTLAHHGMLIVPVPYGIPEMSDLSEPIGASPYGAGTLAAPDGSRQPSEKELTIARYQGRHVANVVARLNSPALATTG